MVTMNLHRLVYLALQHLQSDCRIDVSIHGNGNVEVKLFDDLGEEREDGTDPNEVELPEESVLRLAAFSKSLDAEVKLRKMSRKPPESRVV